MNPQPYDLIVIGGGPGGYVCAIRAAQLGLKAAVVEKESLGGVCLNWGCIPTKSLLHTTDLLNTIRDDVKAGVFSGQVTPNLPAIVAQSRQVAARLSGGIKYLLDKNRVTVIEGHGKLAGKGTVTVERVNGSPLTLTSDHIVIATGARASAPPGFEPDDKHIVTYRSALIPDRIPASMVILGGGVIGMEFASFYNALGTAVTVAEMSDRLLSGIDEDCAAVVRKQLIRRGVKFVMGAKAAVASKNENGVDLTLTQNGKTIDLRVAQVLVATGISANIETIGLETTGVTVTNGRIVVDGFCQTSEPGIYAIGDVGAAPWLAHKASHEGVICAEFVAGKHPTPLSVQQIPNCIFTDPQIASIGLTESQAHVVGHDVKVGKFPLMANGKALAIGAPEGMVKVVFDGKTRRLLGAHLVGPEVTEMVQGFAIALAMKCTMDDLAHVIFPHPTLSEAMHEAVLAADNRALHF